MRSPSKRIELTDALVMEGFYQAYKASRRRHPILIHDQGAYNNEVYNFICADSYMQPHMHPSQEKVETIQVISGEAAVIYFDDNGFVTNQTILEEGSSDIIEIPAFTWHTYIMLSDEVITYEIMNGIYDPVTWKIFADWAPKEGTPEGIIYHKELINTVLGR